MGEAKGIRRVEDMEAYRLCFDPALEVEKTTRGFGPDFRWQRRQLLRASESLPTQMTEGFYSQYSTEYLQALYRSRREAREVQTHLEYAANAGVLAVTSLTSCYEDALRQISVLTSAIERKILEHGKGKPRAHSVREVSNNYLLDSRDDPHISEERQP